MKMFSFDGKLDRGNFFGLVIFFYMLPYVFVLFTNKNEVFGITSFLCAYGILSAIIKRANSFTDTPWFYGIPYISYVLLSVIRTEYEANEVNLDNAYQYGDSVVTIFYAWAFISLIWIGMFFVLCFKKEKKE